MAVNEIAIERASYRTKGPAMSKNASVRPPRKNKVKPDRRILKTRDRLGDALIALMQEKPFDAIKIQEVLDRAGISRSTFYMHYRDKDDLFLSDAEDFLELFTTHLSRTKEASERVAPVREFFSHVAESRPLVDALVASGRIHPFMELARGYFARGIERRLAELPRGRRVPEQSRSAMAHAQAGALLSLMTWWLQRGNGSSAAEMDELFHRSFWSGAAATATYSDKSGVLPRQVESKFAKPATKMAGRAF
jgi:AcrR family transcriptional regulator